MTTINDFMETIDELKLNYNEAIERVKKDPNDENIIRMNSILYAMWRCDNILKAVF